MKRKYKLLFIIIFSTLITYFIYFNNLNKKITLMALGDGVSSGETTYQIDGISYNDYLKEYFDSKKILKNYNDTYANKNITIEDLILKIDNNYKSEKDRYNINQLLHKSDIITICFGEEELINLKKIDEFNLLKLKNYIEKYDLLISKIKKITNAKIFIIGYYENSYLDKTTVIILNSEISNLSKKYDITFINVSDLLLDNNYFLDNNKQYFNYKGHRKIADMIINSF